MQTPRSPPLRPEREDDMNNEIPKKKQLTKEECERLVDIVLQPLPKNKCDECGSLVVMPGFAHRNATITLGSMLCFTKMTPNDINAAIAEDVNRNRHPRDYVGIPRPDYFHSLDDIRAAAMERFKTTEEILAFDDALNEVAGLHRKPWQLTAAGWCEAYLRAVGKWKE